MSDMSVVLSTSLKSDRVRPMRGAPFKAVVTLVAALVLSSSCIFRPSTYQGVIGSRSGRVFLTRERFYHVGLLPDGWQRMRVRARTVSFYHPGYRSSISTDAICGRGASDRSLVALSGEMASAVEGRTLLSETTLQLAGRGALRQRLRGSQDGVPVLVDLVVLRKDGCVFDFYAVMPPEPDAEAVRDFEAFFGGFRYP